MLAASALGALATAGVLGVTHAIEPDHVAGISSLTSRYGDARLSALVGACFSVGHAALVAVWLGVSYLLLERTSFPAVYDAVGTLGAGLLLGVLGAAMAAGGLRAARYGHSHGDQGHHYHLHLPLVGASGHDDHDHDHDITSYLKTGLVGALFTLSPPLSMMAFVSALFPQYGPGVVTLSVAAYTVTITATMSLVGAGAGTFFRVTQDRGARVYGVAQFLAGGLVVVLAATMVTGTLPSLLV